MSSEEDSTRRGTGGQDAKAALTGRRAAIGLLLGALLIAAPIVFALNLRKSPHTETAAIGGPFNLVDQTGRPADQSRLLGRWSAVFFGYTYCPDVCPATLQRLGEAARRLGPAAKTLQVVFISIDPARDTPDAMNRYLRAQALPVPAVGLTGRADQVARAAKAFDVYYAKNGAGEDYTMDHSAAIYLMDPRGRFRRPLAPNMTPDQMADQIAAAQKEP